MKLIETLRLLKNPIKFIPDKKIKKEIILKILEAARWAPSAENEQVWRFLVVDDQSKTSYIKEAIKEGDPRLIKRLSESREPNEEELNKSGFKFNENYFNIEFDDYKSEIQEVHESDILCAETTSTFIICCHSTRLYGKKFGETDVGAAIINIILATRDFDMSIRWIRSFNRDHIRNTFKLPRSLEIDAILAVGFPFMTEDSSFKSGINSENFLSLNYWDFPFRLQKEFSEIYNQKETEISTIDAILDRRSIRKYREGPNYIIPLLKSYEIAQSGLIVPLTIKKPYLKIIVINNPKLRSDIASSAKILFKKQTHVQQVPLIILVAFEAKNATAFYGKIDAGAVVQLILLKAYSMGLGSCWIGAFSRRIARDLITGPKNWHISSLVTIGYSKNYPTPPPRINLGKMGFYNDLSEPIVKPHKFLSPKSHVFSLVMRSIKKPNTKTLLREINAGCKNTSFLLKKPD